MPTATELSNRAPQSAGRLRPLLSRLSIRWRGLFDAPNLTARPSLVFLELASPAGFLPKAAWGSVVASAPTNAKIILSGEPLLSPDFENVLLATDRRGLHVTVQTDGTRLEEFAPVIFGLDAAAVTLRLHGPEDVHNAAFNSRGAFACTVRGAIALKALSGSTCRPRLIVEIPISADNHSRLVEAVECAVGMGADSTVIRHARPGLLADRTAEPIDLAVLASQIQKICDRWPVTLVRFAPDLIADELPRYYSSPRSFGPSRCFVPWKSITVSADSELCLCPSAPVGAYSGQSLSAAFNSAPAQSFRHSVYRSLPRPCATCPRRFSE